MVQANVDIVSNDMRIADDIISDVKAQLQNQSLMEMHPPQLQLRVHKIHEQTWMKTQMMR